MTKRNEKKDEANQEVSIDTDADVKEESPETGGDMVLRLVDEAKGNISTAKLRAHLLISDLAKNDKEANKIIRDAGIVASRGASGFRANLYERLIEGYLELEDFAAMIKSESKNTRNHSAYYWGIVKLANDIRDSMTDTDETEETSA